MSIGMKIKKWLLEYLVLVFIVILAVVTAIVEPKFFSSANLNNILRQFGPLSFVALGMTFVIIGGYVDLSVAGIMSLVTVVTVSLIDPIGQFPALIAGILLGAAMGFINGSLLLAGGANTQAKALFITYGMSTLYGAIALMYTEGGTPHMSWLTTPQTIFTALGSGSVGFISVSFIVFLLCLIVLHIFLTKTSQGMAIRITGGNKVAGELSGVPVNRSLVLIFTLSGMMAAVGAIVLFSRTTMANPAVGEGYELNAILAVVLGGTSLKGGYGNVLRTVLGVLLVTLMANCLDLLRVSTYYQTAFKGLILVLAIWLDNRNKQQEGE